ncbi:MAG: hypothetical protein GY778_05265, partial [bacterium]|nr:hypothetical protein [bacterium]
MADTVAQPGEPLRVLMVVDQDILDRLGSVVRHLCVGMLDEPVRVTVLSRTPLAVPGDSIGPARVVYPRRRRWPWSNPTAAELLASIGDDRPHIVHCLSADLARWARKWATAWKSGLIVHVTDMVDI